MICNCIGGIGGYPCPCQRQYWGYQWPFYSAAPRPGWICAKCQASVNPDVQQCPACTPITSGLIGQPIAASNSHSEEK